MAAFSKFNQFVADVHNKVHNLSSDTLKVMLTNTAPIAANAVKADITEIAAGNGYAAGGAVSTQVSSLQSGGVYKLISGNVTFTASGGSIGPFRYAVLYNDTPTSPLKPLIGFWDYTNPITLTDGEGEQITFDPTNGVLQDT